MKQDLKELLRQHEEKLKKALDLDELPVQEVVSREYKEFRKSFMPKNLGFYEKLCNFSEKILKPKLSEEKKVQLNDFLKTAHIEATPEGATSAAIIFPVIFMIFTVVLSLFISIFLSVFLLFTGLGLIMVIQKLPEYYANDWRIKSSNQMVLCIFYVVTYMRHTSNLERAINFASEHLTPPMALDLKKVMWDVENSTFKNVQESLELYLNSWKKWNREFVEAFHLIQSSLYEGQEQRRQQVLNKALERMLEETAEKMTHYAQELKSPITTLHMLGVILPILGLVILPLIVSFSEGTKWWHLSLIYNVALPVIVYYMGKNILSKRPTGYGDTDITELNPELKKYKKIQFTKKIFVNPKIFIALIFTPLILIALSPIILFHLLPSTTDLIDQKFSQLTSFEKEGSGFDLIGYRNSTREGAVVGEKIGPFGIGASIVSFFFPLSLALSVGFYFRIKSKKIIQIRERTKNLEKEFADTLFQLGNRLADGLPAEIALQKVSETSADTATGDFFKIITANIRKSGMSVKQAIFDKNTGAIMNYPSNIIQSSMKVLTQSITKGPRIAAQAIQGVSEYIKQIHKVNERLKDLMAEIISDMKSQIAFLTPVISGIVIGITSMITSILGELTKNVKTYDVSGTGGTADILKSFGQGLPTYDFQLIVGIYTVQIIYILTVISNGIENGADKLNEEQQLGKNLVKSTILYTVFGLIVLVLFNVLAKVVLKST